MVQKLTINTFEEPIKLMTPDAIKRYARHLVLKDIGGPGQQAMLESKVVIMAQAD